MGECCKARSLRKEQNNYCHPEPDECATNRKHEGEGPSNVRVIRKWLRGKIFGAMLTVHRDDLTSPENGSHQS
jgi:hypothetical protein